jgi:hypothetical protein
MSNDAKQAEPTWDIAYIGDVGSPDRVRLFAVGIPGEQWGAIGMECGGRVCVKRAKEWIDMAFSHSAGAPQK